MNAALDWLFSQQLFWTRAENAVSEQAFSTIRHFVREVAFGLMPPLMVIVALLVVALFFYQPRIPRGALWVPAFGLMGGTPKLYLHTRPASLFGHLLKRRHRLSTSRRARRQ